MFSGNRIWLIAAAVVALLLAGGAYWYFAGGANYDGVTFARTDALLPVKAARCETFAPFGWTTEDANQNGTLFSLASQDRSMIASYAGIPVSGRIARGGDGQPGTPPGLFVRQLLQVLTNAPVKVIADGRDYGGFKVMALESGRYGGYALYHIFPLPKDPAGYGVLMRVALGNKDSRASLGTAGAVAAATRCTTISMPQRAGKDFDAAANHGTGITAGCAKGRCDDADLAGAFNAELGTGWAHDDAGHNYAIDVGAWNDAGPDGPGYYAAIGGDKLKLQPGLQ